MGKTYYWLKLKDDFFTSLRIKKMRRLPGGDTLTIIYLKMQLLSLKKDGCLTFQGLEETFVKELALDLDESEENVAMALTFMQSCGLVETSSSDSIILPYVLENTGSETTSTERVRAYRERQKLLQSSNETECNVSCNVSCNVEKEKEKDIEIEIDKSKKARRFVPPTVEEVKEYCLSRNNSVDADRFVDFYEAKGWMVGKNKMKDWKAAVRTWEKDSKPKQEDPWLKEY